MEQGRPLTQRDCCAHKKGKFGHRQSSQGGQRVKMKAAIGVKLLLQAKGCHKLPASDQQLGEEECDCFSFTALRKSTLISDVQSPESGDNTFLSFKPLSLWYLEMNTGPDPSKLILFLSRKKILFYIAYIILGSRFLIY